jgi:hypothetical protein
MKTIDLKIWKRFENLKIIDKIMLVIVVLLLNFQNTFADNKPATPSLKKGYTNITEVGLLFGHSYGGYSSKSNFTAQTFNGYRFSPRLSVGATLGIDWYNSVQVMPVALGIRGDVLKNKKATPYYGLDAGYGFTFLTAERANETDRGGFMINPTIGIKLNIGGGNSLTMSLGWKRQLTQTTSNPYNTMDATTRFWYPQDYSVTSDKYFNRFSFRIGMSF